MLHALVATLALPIPDPGAAFLFQSHNVSTPGGAKLAFTQTFLDYVSATGKASAISYISNYPFPNPVTQGDDFSISWDVHDLKLANIDMQIGISLDAPTSLTISISDLEVDIQASVHAREDVWPHPTLNIGLAGDADGSSATATLALHTDGEGVPSISLTSCTPEIRANHLRAYSCSHTNAAVRRAAPNRPSTRPLLLYASPSAALVVRSITVHASPCSALPPNLPSPQPSHPTSLSQASPAESSGPSTSSPTSSSVLSRVRSSASSAASSAKGRSSRSSSTKSSIQRSPAGATACLCHCHLRSTRRSSIIISLPTRRSSRHHTSRLP